MSNIAIHVENLGKQYRIGERQPYKALRDTLSNSFYAPFQFMASLLNGRNGHNGHQSIVSTGSSTDRFWALNDVSFEIKKGEAVGIIGRNGAGKSTLLKILSRITKPTEGYVRIHGRIGSLLEVGTGFHPELTGRENVYLNGAIIGMRKKEIDRKFDEIVAFAELETFIDTPVKFYSSGMYVRLAFAVAAHLEPEILLVDEVLAVGDAAFQKKCMGKMGKVAKEGRTVLFVSHNMSAMSSLCNRVLLFEKGAMVFDGPARRGIDRYSLCPVASTKADLQGVLDRQGPGKFARLKSIELFNGVGQPCDTFSIGDTIVMELELVCMRSLSLAEIGIALGNTLGTSIHYFVSTWEGLEVNLEVGIHRFRAQVPKLLVYPGTYTLTPWVNRRGAPVDDQVAYAITMVVLGSDLTGHKPSFEQYTVSNCEVYCPSTWGYLNFSKAMKEEHVSVEPHADCVTSR
jgi:lipopolysaccharide transport system ATP-binding protein